MLLGKVHVLQPADGSQRTLPRYSDRKHLQGGQDSDRAPWDSSRIVLDPGYGPEGASRTRNSAALR